MDDPMGLGTEDAGAFRALRFSEEQSIYSKFPFDLNGHDHGWEPEEWEKKQRETTLFMELVIIDPGILYAARQGGEPRVVNGDLYTLKCRHCDEQLRLMTDGKKLWLDPPCPHPNGIEATEFDLNVPSGRLIVANDLRHLFPIMDDHFDINKVIGCHRTTLAYAKAGMAHGFVGNTCPSLTRWRGKGGGYRISTSRSEGLAGICTDLWWYSICDADEFARRCAWRGIDAAEAEEWFQYKAVDVKPGTYRFRHLYPKDHYVKNVLYFTEIRRVGEPGPVQELLADYANQNVTVQQFLYTSLVRWPTLFVPRGRTLDSLTPDEFAHALARASDHCLVVLGNGVDWHSKGFPEETVVPNVPAFDIPRFQFQIRWYPLSRGSALMAAAGFAPEWDPDRNLVLAPDFARLGFNILESILRFGVKVSRSTGGDEEDIKRARYTMTEAVKCYYGLKERYPDCSYPDFDAWMADRAQVEKWVEDFPLSMPEVDKRLWDLE